MHSAVLNLYVFTHCHSVKAPQKFYISCLLFVSVVFQLMSEFMFYVVSFKSNSFIIIFSNVSLTLSGFTISYSFELLNTW
jgi:hypothetical protein